MKYIPESIQIPKPRVVVKTENGRTITKIIYPDKELKYLEEYEHEDYDNEEEINS